MADIPVGKLPLSLSEADAWKHFQVDHSLNKAFQWAVCVHGEREECWKHTYSSVVQVRVRALSKMFPLHLHCSVILALTPGGKWETGWVNNRLTLPWMYFLQMGQLFCCWLCYTSPPSKEGTRVAMFSNPAVLPGAQLHQHTRVNSKWSFYEQSLVPTDHFKCPRTSSRTWSSWSPAHRLCTRSHLTLARFLLSPLLFPSFLYIMFSLIPHCGALSSSHVSVFLAAWEATYALSGSELRVCCPLCQCAHAVHAVEPCLLQCRRAEPPFPLLLRDTSSAISTITCIFWSL